MNAWLLAVFLFTAQPNVTAAEPPYPSPIVKVNRTVPQVEPPKTTLEFSANPTSDDLFRARLFEEPLVPIGADPAPEENAALATALLGYSKRTSPDDFSSLTGFLEKYPRSAWQAALLTDLGLEYYNTAHYSLALEAWSKAWPLAKDATDAKGRAIADRAGGEIAYMYARLGDMAELEAFLTSVECRVFCGPATEKISGARQGLWNMKYRPEIAFRCGPLALHRIKLLLDPQNAGDTIIHAAASTQNGFSLPEVAELSQKLGLNYQMAYREQGADFVVPSVVHWKVGHYAAMVRQEGDRYLLQDPTFQNDVWVTKPALEAETSGYFLVPLGALPAGWRTVGAKEAEIVRGKGNTCCNDPKPHGPCDPHTQGGGSCSKDDDPCTGMAVPSVHLSMVSLNLKDEPVGYSPPVGPAVRFKVRYNQRDAFQPGNFSYSNLGSKWTFDWLSYITDDPSSPNADVQYYIMGGGTRDFTGFDSGTHTYAYQQFDQTKLTRTSATRYEMLSRDGSMKVFSQSDGSTGTTRKIFLTQVTDPFGHAVSLTYDVNLRLVALTDAIGQVTTLSYELPNDTYKITRVTDPFGRFATFEYNATGQLKKITDVIGLTSEFTYDGNGMGDFIHSLITPYGTTTFTNVENGNTRSLETLYPDGSRERVEYNQSENLPGIPGVDPAPSVPTGMATINQFLFYRNTYYWSKSGCAEGYGDYSKATIYHWLHTADFASTSGILESVKAPLEGRVWYDYAGQSSSLVVGTSNKPTHVGRVLDDGSTQLYTYEYNSFGNKIKEVDPLGRTFSYVYAENGIDLLETRQTRAGNNELLSKTDYNAQHLPLTSKDAAGLATTFSYNARRQLLTATNTKGEATTYTYDPNGYLTTIDGPLPGTADSTIYTHDSLGRMRSRTDVDGYTLTYDYDSLNRTTKITYPDNTFIQFAYTRLDLVTNRDRAGQLTQYEYNSARQITARTDRLCRVFRYQWCACDNLQSITDPMGRTTAFQHDIQGRTTRKTFADGSAIAYVYENTTSRLHDIIDEKLQVTHYEYNLDNTRRGVSYSNATSVTPAVTYTFDPNYKRITSMTDGSGTTLYTYYPITTPPMLGAGELASIDGPQSDDAIGFSYDELGRIVSRTINAVATTVRFDVRGRVANVSNSLGTFDYAYDGASRRRLSITRPNGITTTLKYFGTLNDRLIERTRSIKLRL